MKPGSSELGGEACSGWSVPLMARWLVPVVLAIAVLASACSSTATESTTDGALVSFSILRDEAVSEIRLSERAAILVASRCMQRQGFRAPEVDLSAALSPGVGPALPPLDRDTAESIGYGRPDQVVEQPEIGFDRYFASLSDAERFEWGVAYFGADGTDVSVEMPGGMVLSVPGEGCLAEARRTVRGNNEARTQGLLMQIQALAVDVQALVNADAAVRASAERWRRCMAQQGFSFEELFEAIDYALSTRSAGDHAPTLMELEIAIADSDCREASGYTSSVDDATRQSGARVLSDNEAVVLAWKEVGTLIRQHNRELLPVSLSEASGAG